MENAIFFQFLLIFSYIYVVQCVEEWFPSDINHISKNGKREGCYDNPLVNCAGAVCDMDGKYYNYQPYQWAVQNCPLYCGICQEVCQDDPRSNCRLYNRTVLCNPSGVHYMWASVKCPAYCGLCQETFTASTFSVTTDTTNVTKIVAPNTPPTPPYAGESKTGCNDNPLVNCAGAVCDMDGKYYNYQPYQWAVQNCPLYCGICQEVCQDDSRSNCRLYNRTVLCNPSGVHYMWASVKCPAYCGLCQVCEDSVDCRVYNATQICSKTDIYYAWSQKHCPLHCGFCQAPTRIVPCQDRITNCDEYPSDVCVNPLYRLWREDNCRKYCGICSGFDVEHFLLPSLVDFSHSCNSIDLSNKVNKEMG
ncbi:uncharacterized protein LOC111132995 isoform X2 [Crassostrea virginica]